MTLAPDTLSEFKQSLSSSIHGSCDFSSAGVAMYTSDASNYRQIPLGIVCPKNADDIRATARLCLEHALPILMRGGGRGA